jgi:hypothetical protein
MDFVCFSINNWEKRKARKHQFMSALSLRSDVGKVIYVEPALNFWRLLFFSFIELKNSENRKRWKRALSFKPEALSNKLFLYTPIFFIPFSFRFRPIYDLNLYFSYLLIKTELSRLDFKDIVLWVYHPFDGKLLKWFKDRIFSCFDWAEEWAQYFKEYSSEQLKVVRMSEEQIISIVDEVFVVSQRLLEDAQRINPNSYLLRDGTIPEMFCADIEAPSDIKDVKHPIAGYLGTVHARFDFSLIDELSDRFKQCSFVFVGNVLLPEEDLLRLKSRSNIFFLGGKNYDLMAGYLKFFDVCILPYKADLLFTPPPTKIYDYFASGKPIVSTSLEELKAFSGYIKMASNNKEFGDFLESAFKDDDVAASANRIAFAKKNSWQARADEIVRIINERLKIKNTVKS